MGSELETLGFTLNPTPFSRRIIHIKCHIESRALFLHWSSYILSLYLQAKKSKACIPSLICVSGFPYRNSMLHMYKAGYW